MGLSRPFHLQNQNNEIAENRVQAICKGAKAIYVRVQAI